MSWEIAFDGKDVLVTAHGRATVDGLQEMTIALLDDPRFALDSTVILDYRDLDWGSMSVADLRSRARGIIGYRTSAAEARVAFVTAGTAERGLFRMIEAFADEDGGIWFDWIVVQTLAEARAWLRPHD
jgi:hypothetical protein